MKHTLYLFILLGSLFHTEVHAQQAQVGCVDNTLRVQAEQMKHDFKAQDMEVFMDAMINMVSRKAFPVAVKFEAHQLYQIIFIGNLSADKIEMGLYDTERIKIDERIINERGKHKIIYSFTPSTSGIYGIVIKQKVKGQKEICGSFTIMEKSKEDKAEPLQ